jgi:pimeloyl-ACP methyl ester carboxylesterase
MDQIEVAGLRIAYERRGEGPPIVLLHGGFGFDSRQWRRQLNDLSDEFTVVAWDAPGSGRSSDPPETFRLRDYADSLSGFIDGLGLGRRPHVLGLSFGAGLALELYRQHPKVPRTLVLAGAYAGWAGSLPAEVVEQRLQRALREADLPPEEWLPGYMPGMFSESAPQALIDEALSIMTDVHPVGMRVGLRAFAEADLRDVLPHPGPDTVAAWGARPTLAPVRGRGPPLPNPRVDTRGAARSRSRQQHRGRRSV